MTNSRSEARAEPVMDIREELEIELALAEAELTEAEERLAKAEADPANKFAMLDKARSRCRRAQLRCDQLVTALVELSHAQRNGKSAEEIENLIKRMVGGPELDIGARAFDQDTDTGSTQMIEPLMRGAEEPEEETGDVVPDTGYLAFPQRKYLLPGDALALRLLARQSVMLLGLVLAYLQYYFTDVQLQIAMLPSVVSAYPLS